MAERRRDRAVEAIDVVDDLHRPAAEHVARPHERRVPDPLDDLTRLCHRGCRATGRLGYLEPGAQGRPPLAVLRRVDRRRSRAEHERGREPARELERRLAAEPDDHSLDPAGASGRISAATMSRTASSVIGSK